jgi:hypothetical protein
MLKSARSPVRGYNHNVKYRGRVFHVQTEESGPGSPRISTHLYFGGTILASKRHEYDPAAPPEIVRALMQSQHKSILRDLKAGRNDAHLLQFFTARGEVLEPVALSNASGDDEFPDEGVVGPAHTPRPVVTAAPPVPPVPVMATPPPLPASAVAMAVPLPNPIVADAPIRFSEDFEDEPTNPEERAHHASTLAARAARGTPALGSSVVRIERIVSLGEKTPPPALLAGRTRRPAPSFPYVVQEGSHPVQDGHGHPVTAVAAPAGTVTSPMLSPPMAAPIAAGPVSVVSNDTAAPGSVPPPPPAPLVPAAPEAPLTAAELGATPEAPVSREDNQSLDEVIMAYLSRGVDRDINSAG